MEFTTCYCPHPQCTHYGQRGFGTHLVHCGADRGIPRLLCTRCQSTFSVRQGTAYFGVRAEEPNYTIAMRALVLSLDSVDAHEQAEEARTLAIHS